MSQGGNFLQRYPNVITGFLIIVALIALGLSIAAFATKCKSGFEGFGLGGSEGSQYGGGGTYDGGDTCSGRTCVGYPECGDAGGCPQGCKCKSFGAVGHCVKAELGDCPESPSSLCKGNGDRCKGWPGDLHPDIAKHDCPKAADGQECLCWQGICKNPSSAMYHYPNGKCPKHCGYLDPNNVGPNCKGASQAEFQKCCHDARGGGTVSYDSATTTPGEYDETNCI